MEFRRRPLGFMECFAKEQSGPFLGGSERRAVVQTRPVASKIFRVPSAFR